MTSKTTFHCCDNCPDGIVIQTILTYHGRFGQNTTTTTDSCTECGKKFSNLAAAQLPKHKTQPDDYV